MRSLSSVLALFLAFFGHAPQDPVKIRPDGRVGLVVDQQGLGTMRPIGRTRWTAIHRGRVLIPGDQLRTSPRGANAVEVQLPSGGSLLLGPGAMIELEAVGRYHLLHGDVELRPAKGETLSLRGPGGYLEELSESSVLRATATTTLLDRDPRWLSGYRSSTTDEWLGSLVAQIDGREVPLSVGYHKVDVDIKDQIARTTVEQSFVNATRGRLEGVFYFPLPAGASISGFGMWIGGELVEADIVEKQRAREIFEDILRRKKDPGLLEWSGGNLFKARVFPIEAHSEKRIRIRYTQALPRQGNSLRYRYALRSELLRSHPLRELSIHLSVDSAAKITELSSPSHEVITRKTDHNAVVDFSAHEYTPQQDFELNIGIEAGRAVTMIPHRRGEDGYFMLQLTPPGSDSGDLRRELTAEGEPIDVLILADTSASMGTDARKAQASFVAALLALLGEEDRFRLLTVDLAVRPFRTDASPATAANLVDALRFLEARESLGWTDLDLAFDRALAIAEPGSTIVYLGDGIGTTGDADPIALAGRLRRLANRSEVTCHAVSTSSTYEQPVLDAIATIGGGSTRAIGSDPVRMAERLLAEVAQPMIKDLAVTFEGIRVARVYPEHLPNLSAGSQQIILGRYSPGAEPQSGKIVVRGMLYGKPVEFSSEILMPGGDAGNSFIPRLWARKHVDALLREGHSPQVIADIVAFSEEFGIMTPYTSLLVLESDADRERYGVDRRVKMRDGEGMFAAARDRAHLEILRQQMALAKTWRMQLWHRMAGEIDGLGEDLYAAPVAYAYGNEYAAGGFRKSRLIPGDSGHLGGEWEDDLKDFRDEDVGDEDVRDAPLDGFSRAEQRERQLPGEGLYAKQSKVMAERTLGQGFGRANMQQAFGASLRGSLGRRRNAYYPKYGFELFHFPAWPAIPAELPKVATPAWPTEVFQLLERMDRRKALEDAAVEIELSRESLHPRRGHRTQISRLSGLLTQKEWYLASQSRGSKRLSSWLFRGKLALVDRDFMVGRRRDASPTDQDRWPLPLSDYSAKSMSRRYAGYRGEVIREQRGPVRLVFTAPLPVRHRVQLVLDEVRHVVLSVRSGRGDGLEQITRFSEFIAVAGQFWPTRIETHNAAGRLIQRQKLSVTERSAEEFRRIVRAKVEGQADTLFLARPDPEIGTAKQAVFEGKGDFADHLRLVVSFSKTQQWDEAWREFALAHHAMGDKPAVPWLRAALLSLSRRGEELASELSTLSLELQQAPEPWQVVRADYLLKLAAGSLQAEEQRELLTSLRGHYFAPGPDSNWRQQTWLRRQALNLQERGRYREALQVYESLAESHPDELQDLLRYLQLAAGQGMANRAIEMGRQRLAEGRDLDEYESYQLHDSLTNLLWQQRRLPDLNSLLTAWIAENPTQEVAYQRYLSVLMFLGRDADADRWIGARLAEQLGDSPDRARIARIGAAISVSLGQGWQFYSYRLEDEWIQPLKALALRLARGETDAITLARRILQHHLFRQTDAYTEVRAALGEQLMTEDAIEAFDLRRLGLYLGWIDWRRDRVDEALWRRVADGLMARWQVGENTNDRPQIAQLLLQVLDQHGAPLAAIKFSRMRLLSCTEVQRPQVARDLMNRISAGAWSEEIEAELFTLISKLVPAGQVGSARQETLAMAVRQLAHTLIRMRRAALLGERAQYEQLPRAALREKRRAGLSKARTSLVASFAAAANAADPGDRAHYEIERLCFAVRLQDDLRQCDGEARELLASLGQDDGDDLSRILRQRSSLVMAYAATRRKAPADLAESLLQLYRSRFDADPQLLDWRHEIFRLLVVLDRPAELERELRSWSVPSQVASDWQIALGYLLAETGRMREAVEVFEVVVTKGELGPREQAALAAWYTSLSEDARSEQTTLARYQAMSEQELSQRLYQVSNRSSRQGPGLPQDLDPDSLRVLRVLLAKATHPGNYIHQIIDLYSKTKDFRLLASLGDGILGHSAQQVYPFLSQAWQVIGVVHEEATCDLLDERITELMQARVGVDLRALWLLEFMVERRASEVLNAPDMHGERALAAMRKAFKGEWAAGERRLMAELLGSLGKIPLAPLAAEQLRELRELYRGETHSDRLKIGFQLAMTLWNYGQRDDAVDLLWTALGEHHGPGPGAYGQETNKELGTILSWWHTRQRLAKAEEFLEQQLLQPGSGEQRDWFLTRLFDTYLLALQHGNPLRGGHAASLYPVARARMEDALFRSGPQHLQNMFQQFLGLHRVAEQYAGVAQAGADLERFAQNRLAKMLTRSNGDRQSLVQQIGTQLYRLNGPVSGLRFYLGQVEGEPAWLRRVGRGGWQAYGSYLGQWRREVSDLGELKPRLLTLVLAELERDLIDKGATNRSMYQVGSSYFWAEYRQRFISTAESVLARRADSAAHQLYIAEYYWQGLRMHPRAIEILFAADRRGCLSVDGRYRLVSMLHEQRRWDESIPLLAGLIELQPNRLDYRLSMVRALHEDRQDERSRAFLDRTVQHLREQQRLDTNALSAAAQVGITCGFWQRSIDLYEELIPLHQASTPGRGIGDGSLSSYYGLVARAYAGLGESAKAVEAASAAVVAWGRDQQNRQSAITALESVVRRIADLPAYEQHWDAEVAASGMDSALIRRTLGRIYLEEGHFDRAIHNLLGARALQPEDAGIYPALVQAHEKAGDPLAAIEAVRMAIAASPMNLDLYQELAQRLTLGGKHRAAERAWTSLVEILPGEADSHRRLARAREANERYAEAVIQWQQVVRIRSLEPEGWFSLARAQGLGGMRSEAIETLRLLVDRTWPERFGDVHSEAARKLSILDRSRPPR